MELPINRVLFALWLAAMSVAVTRLVIGMRQSSLPPLTSLPSVGPSGAELRPASMKPMAGMIQVAAGRGAMLPPGDLPVSPAVETRPEPTRTRQVAPPPATDAGDRDASPVPAAESAAPEQPDSAAEESAPEPVIPTAEAREALPLVGMDPQADALWAAAINDPARPAEERKDLIEDLNEEGFPDPRRVTSDDLPLIRSRLVLIEAMAPDALDDVNAAAFIEAYRDLVRMYQRVTR